MNNPNDADQCCDETLVQDLQCATVSRSCIKYLPDKININIWRRFLVKSLGYKNATLS